MTIVPWQWCHFSITQVGNACISLFWSKMVYLSNNLDASCFNAPHLRSFDHVRRGQGILNLCIRGEHLPSALLTHSDSIHSCLYMIHCYIFVVSKDTFAEYNVTQGILLSSFSFFLLQLSSNLHSSQENSI